MRNLILFFSIFWVAQLSIISGQEVRIESQVIPEIIYNGYVFDPSGIEFGSIAIINDSDRIISIETSLITLNVLPYIFRGNEPSLSIYNSCIANLNSNETITQELELRYTDIPKELKNYPFSAEINVILIDSLTQEVLNDTILQLETVLIQPDLVSPTFTMENTFSFTNDPDGTAYDFSFPIDHTLSYNGVLVYELTSFEHSDDLSNVDISCFSEIWLGSLTDYGKQIIPMDAFYNVSLYEATNIEPNSNTFIKLCANIYDPWDSLNSNYDFCMEFLPDPSYVDPIDSLFFDGFQDNYCMGDTMKLTPKDGFENIKWYIDGEEISSDNSQLIYELAITDFHYLKVTADDAKGINYVFNKEFYVNYPYDPYLYVQENSCKSFEFVIDLFENDNCEWFLNGDLVSSEKNLFLKTSDILLHDSIFIKGTYGQCKFQSSYLLTNYIYPEYISINSNSEDPCIGQEVTLQPDVNLLDAVWKINGEKVNSDSIVVKVSGDYSYIELYGMNEDSCLVFSNYYLSPSYNSPQAIYSIDNTYNGCNEFILNANDQATNVVWKIGENEITGNNIVHDFNEYFLYTNGDAVMVRCLAEIDGCIAESVDYVYNDSYYNFDIDTVGNPNFCPGEEIEIQASEEIEKVVWYDNNSQSIVGTDISYLSKKDEESLFVNVINNEGCYSYRDYYLNKNQEISENLIESSDYLPESCSTVKLQAKDGFDTYKWYNNFDGSLLAEGQTTELEVFDITSNRTKLILEATIGGCTKTDYKYFSRDVNYRNDLIDDSSLLVACVGDEVTLETFDPFKERLWEYRTYNSVFASTLEKFKFTLEDIESNLTLRVLDENGCLYRQTYYPSVSKTIFPNVIPCQITVTPDQTNYLSWTLDGNAERIEQLNIFKEGRIQGDFELIESIDASQNYYEDLNVYPDVENSLYYISQIDVCGEEKGRSNSPLFNSIHLTGNLGTDNEINLTWDHKSNRYFYQYYILRGSSPDNMKLIDTITSSIQYYTDCHPLDSENYYSIAADYSVSCGYTSDPQISYSNVYGFSFVDVKSLNDSEILVYPNPFNHLLSIQVDDNYKFDIIDINGRSVYANNFTKGNHTISIPQISEGIYLLQFTGTKDIYYTKIQKSN